MQPSRLIGILLATAIAGGITGASSAATMSDPAGTSLVIRGLSGSKTATSVTLPQVLKAAGAKFDELDAEHDGTLDRTETAGIMSYSEFTLANTRHDATPGGTLSRAEYMAFVQKLFMFANIQDTGTAGSLSASELASEPGVELVALLKY